MPHRPNVWTSLLLVRIFFTHIFRRKSFITMWVCLEYRDLRMVLPLSLPSPTHPLASGLSPSPIPSQQAQKNTIGRKHFIDELCSLLCTITMQPASQLQQYIMQPACQLQQYTMQPASQLQQYTIQPASYYSSLPCSQPVNNRSIPCSQPANYGS